MLRFYTDKFLLANRILESMDTFVTHTGNINAVDSIKVPLQKEADTLYKILTEIGLTLSSISAQRIIRYLQDTPKIDDRFSVLKGELSRRIEDELKTRVFLAISPDKERFFNPPENIWGDEVTTKLSELSEDIVEAHNCYALDRYTSCVFHLMRVMEKSVQKFADKLGLLLSATRDKEWQTIINDIRKQLNNLYIKHSDPERIKYEATLGHLETVKIAWRNPTMHPKATYTEEQAKMLLSATEIFIKDLVNIL